MGADMKEAEDKSPLFKRQQCDCKSRKKDQSSIPKSRHFPDF